MAGTCHNTWTGFLGYNKIISDIANYSAILKPTQILSKIFSIFFSDGDKFTMVKLAYGEDKQKPNCFLWDELWCLCCTFKGENPCPGCREITADSPKTIFSCQIRICTERKKKYCLDCNKFPCEKLRHLDKRYREKYGMSEIENLEYIRDHGIDKFIKNERQRWQSSKGIHCVHNKKYY